MRITFGTFRAGIRDPAITVSLLTSTRSFPSPVALATAAIKRYHRDGLVVAEQQLNRSLSGYWSGTPQRKGWANSIRSAFENYIQMDINDSRTIFSTGFSRDIQLAGNQLATYVDVLLLDGRGYAGRVALWDASETTAENARIIAAACFQAMEEELGQGRVTEVNIWKLRTRVQHTVDRPTALSALPSAAAVVARMAR
jgi:hypothetical protein